MPASHGWTDEAARSYPADRADRARERRIAEFRERSTMIAAAYSGDPRGYLVEYSRHCEANADLADEVSEIADYLEEHRRFSEMDDRYRREDEAS